MDALGVLFIGLLAGLCIGIVVGVSVSAPIAAILILAVFVAAMLFTICIDGAGEAIETMLDSFK